MNKNDKEFIAQKIRAQYVEKQSSELDELRELDARVKRPATVFAYVFGSISAIVMGAGMSLIMTEIGDVIGISDPLLPGVIIGSIGLIMAAINYPIYNAILSSRKKKLAPRIIELSEKLMDKSN